MASRFLAALARVLREETGYAQPVGGPYVRLVVTPKWNERRRRRGLGEYPTGRYVLDYFSRKLRHEGGTLVAIPAEPDGMAFDDHPKDTGGRTGMGILQREYDSWCRLNKLPKGDVWAISDDELTAIYRAQYWDACNCDQLEPGVDAFTFNTAVNAGVGIGIRQLQSAAGARVDGHMGLATIAAANAQPAKEAVHKLAAMQARRYPTLHNFATFGDNWLGRNKRVEIECAAEAQDIAADHPAIVETIASEAPRDPDAGRTARALYEPPSSPLESSEGKAAAAVGGGGVWDTSTEVSTAIAAVAASGQGFSVEALLLALASSPTFWRGVFLIGAGAFLWLKRGTIREQFGI